MYRILYGIPFREILLGLFFSYIVWSYAKVRLGKRKVWKIFHVGVILLWLGVSLYVVILSRSRGNGGINLEPFWSYRMAFMEGSYDYFQEIYLNVMAFYFFGLFAPELLKGNYRYLVTIVGAMVLSIAIEYGQYRLDVGLAELDDVFSNTVGVVLGAVANWISYKYFSGFVKVVKRWTESLLQFLHRHTTE
ncbi:MAG: VanZ family protein [Roseburia sp.]|nr:VanZ family protein [Roseburia sp.]